MIQKVTRSLRVVLVDDDARFRTMARRALMAEGVAEVTEVADSATAGEAVAMCRPDVVLVDIRMPGVDGPEVARRLQAMPGERPVVILVSTIDVEHGDRLARGVGAAYLPKDEISLAAILELSARLRAPGAGSLP